jgi:sulfur carrier protein
MSTSIGVVINGQSREIEDGTTIFVLLDQLGFGDRRVAVERNREIVPRAQHATTVIVAGDRLELVTFVGGGS